MKILIACEYSGIVREAFRARGHDAWSCDLLPTEQPGPHYQGDVRDVLGKRWDMMIAHPPCTYLSSSGLHWNGRVPGRELLTEEALLFIRLLMDCKIPRIVIENPVGCISTRIRKPDQIIQPYQFGNNASKKTCLWLQGVVKLTPTLYVPPRITKDGKQRWENQTDSGQDNSTPSDHRGKDRAKTYSGIAMAMATQWSEYQSVQMPLFAEAA